MAIANYSDLKSEIAAYLHRTDLTSVIPDFITLAEADFNATLYLRRLLTYPTAFTQSARFTALPAGFRRMRSVALIANSRRYALTPIAMDALNDFSGDSSSNPQYYVITGGYLGIVPGTSASLEIEYWPTITNLDSGSNTTNAVLTNWPALYLYRSLIEAASYLRDPDLLQQVTTVYGTVLQQAIAADIGDQWGAAPVTVAM